MRSKKVEEILQQHNVELSPELVDAIADIVKAAASDPDVIREISRRLAMAKRLEDARHGIRG